jgi:hypothetical protein
LQSGLFIMPGTTFTRPIFAVLRIPQRTGCMAFSSGLGFRLGGNLKRRIA